MSISSNLGQLTANVVLEKYAEPTVAQMQPNYRPPNYQPKGSEGLLNSPDYQARHQKRDAAINQSSGGNQQQRQQAMQNPASRQEYIRQATQQEKPRIQQVTGQSPQRNPAVAGIVASNQSVGSNLMKGTVAGAAYQGYKSSR